MNNNNLEIFKINLGKIRLSLRFGFIPDLLLFTCGIHYCELDTAFYLGFLGFYLRIEWRNTNE